MPARGLRGGHGARKAAASPGEDDGVAEAQGLGSGRNTGKEKCLEWESEAIVYIYFSGFG